MTFPVSTLIQWLAEAGIEVSVTGATETLVTDLTFDSRTVTKGALFAALPGSRVDGHDFIEKAQHEEASTLLVQRMPKQVTSATVIQVSNSAQALAVIAARFFGPLPTTLQAVTGTNGKTSVAHFVRLLHDDTQAV